MKALNMPVLTELTEAFVDITRPREVEVRIREDRRVVWVNVDGICVLRVCQIPDLEVCDESRLRP
jgi:hypothetical protein